MNRELPSCPDNGPRQRHLAPTSSRFHRMDVGSGAGFCKPSARALRGAGRNGRTLPGTVGPRAGAPLGVWSKHAPGGRWTG